MPSRARRGEVVELRADLLERQAAGVLHDGNDQALFAERRADADVDRRRDGDAVLLPPPVDRRRDGHRFGRRLHDVGGVAELHALRGHRGLVRGDGGEIGFEHGRDMRRFADRADHVLGDRHAHPVVRNVLRRELPRLRGRRLADADDGRAGNRAVDVLARHAAVAARALDARRVDAMLQAGAADGGRQPRLLPLTGDARPERSRRARLRRWRRRASTSASGLRTDA